MARPSRDERFMAQALVAATGSTCPRRSVGCVLVDKHGRVIATGYNGVPAGHPHCIDHPCPGAKYPSGEGLQYCQAIHAEINALVQCRDTMAIKTAYCTTFPCRDCTKVLLNTSCRLIVYGEEYSHAEAMQLWVGDQSSPTQGYRQAVRIGDIGATITALRSRVDLETGLIIPHAAVR